MILFREFLSFETLSAVKLTLTFSTLALLLSWSIALALTSRKIRILDSVFQLFLVLPGFAYALITLFTLRALQVESRYSMASVLFAWVLAGVPYLYLNIRIAMQDLDPREREALRTLGAGPLKAWYFHDFSSTRPAQYSLLLQQFWLYLTSFSIVMILSGGPPNETLEVAIYTSVRLDQVNMTHAWALGLWQFLILLGLRLLSKSSGQGSLGWRSRRPEPRSFIRSFAPGTAALALSFFFMKRAGILSSDFLESLALSLILGFSVASGTVLFSFALYYSKLKFLGEVGAWVSPLLLTLLVWKWVGFSLPPLLCCFFIQCVLFAPWVARSVFPLLDRARKNEQEAAASLGASPWRVWLAVEWPRLSPAVLWTFGFVLSLSLTEVGTVLLFSRNGFEPLSVWVQNAFLRFHLDEAAWGTGVLVLLCYFAVKRESRTA